MEKEDLHLKPAFVRGDKDDIAPALSRRSFFMAAGAAGLGSAATLLGGTSARAQSTDWT